MNNIILQPGFSSLPGLSRPKPLSINTTSRKCPSINRSSKIHSNRANQSHQSPPSLPRRRPTHPPPVANLRPSSSPTPKPRSLPPPNAFAIPGPMFMSGDFGTNKLVSPGGFIRFPLKDDFEAKKTPPLVRVRLAVEYRVHSRQMLCVGGSNIPFGWSFLSIAKVPMSWAPEDIWEVEVELPAGTRVEYKYVILEEQDWTQQVNEAAEGKVEYSYRVQPETSPPDVQRITKAMAIVAWQPGPNRYLQVPSEDELSLLRPGESVERIAPPLPPGAGMQRSYGERAMGKGRGGGSSDDEDGGGPEPPLPEELSGLWEILSMDEQGRPFMDRRDVWGKSTNRGSKQEQ